MRRLLPLFALALVVPAARADDATLARLAPLGGCEKVFVGKLTKVTTGAMSLSDPPIHHFAFEFEVTETLRGGKPDAKTFSYSVVADDAPRFGVGTEYVVGVKRSDHLWVVKALTVDGDDERKLVKKLLSIPAGWKWEKGKPVSPWAGLKEKVWPKDGPKLSETVCSQCRRPALLVGDGIEVTVAQVPAKNPRRFENDQYGDGTFKITVKNATKKDATVPAVLVNGKDILWGDSVLFLYNGEPLVLPTAGKVTKDTKPLELKAGAEVGGEVNALLLDGVEWPRGGSRVYFDIAVGERAVNNFFYYYSDLHDPMREEAVKAIKK